MQLTLVSYYGEKPPGLAALVTDLQQTLCEELGDSFVPYDLMQVHATIVGLEGTRAGGKIRNANFRSLRNEERAMDLAALLEWLRSPRFRPFEVQVGGFKPSIRYPFASQGRHPFARSFSIQGQAAVGMGWPRTGDEFPPVLAQARRECERFGILHKWHPSPADSDNDLYFVLGHCRGTDPESSRRVEERLREQLSNREPLLLPIAAHCLRFLAYSDATVPLASTRPLRLAEPAVTAELLASFFD